MQVAASWQREAGKPASEHSKQAAEKETREKLSPKNLPRDKELLVRDSLLREKDMKMRTACVLCPIPHLFLGRVGVEAERAPHLI